MRHRLRFKRSRMAYWAATAIVVSAHAMLCYPAAISRGHPPLRPFEILALYIAPLFMLVPPLFDDAMEITRIRVRRSIVVTLGFCFSWAVVVTNLNSPRPHVGHLFGFVGVITQDSGFVVIHTLELFIAAIAFFYCLDGVAIGWWSLWRTLVRPERSPDTGP